MGLPRNFKHTTAKDKPELNDQLINMIENELSYPSDQSYKVDFYPLIRETNAQNQHLLLEDDQLVGHVGLQKRYLLYKGEEFPVHLIGGVVLKDSHQGKGLFEPFFNEVLKKYIDQSTFFFLWSDLNMLYEKFDFIEFGLIKEIGDKEYQDSSEFNLINNSELKKEDLDFYKETYLRSNQNCITLKRDDQDWYQILQITSSKLYKSDKCYFFKDKGADLKGIIHEFLPKPPPSWPCRTWISTNSFDDDSKYRFMGLMRLGNSNLVKSFFSKISSEKIEITNILEDSVKFELDDQKYEIGHEQFLQGCFGPSFIEELDNLCPQIVIYGPDSI